MIKLYQFENCPFCEKVRKYMREHGIKWEKIEVDRNNKPEEVTSTGGTVPVIQLEDGTLISDSSRIIEYLEKNVVGKAA